LLLVRIRRSTGLTDLKPANLRPHRRHDEERDGHGHQIDEGHQVDDGVERFLAAFAALANVHTASHRYLLPQGCKTAGTYKGSRRRRLNLRGTRQRWRRS